jgi:hypothetical protein
MFGRGKKRDAGGSNTLSDEAEANVYAGAGSTPSDSDSFGTSETLYGPNGGEVAGLIEALDSIDDEQLAAVAKSSAAVRPADREIAQMMARRLRNDRRLDAPLRAAEARIQEWLEARKSTYDGDAALAEEAAAAARDAVAALILDAELNDADFATLYGPWSDVMDEDTDAGADEAEPGGGAPDDDASPDEGTSPEAEAEAEADDYGPNSELISELLSQLEALSPDQLRNLSGAWVAADRTGMAQARTALEGALEADPDARGELDRAQARVAEWAGDASARFRKVAAPAVEDAVAALAMVDALSEADAATLYGPWAASVGVPELPALEDE